MIAARGGVCLALACALSCGCDDATPTTSAPDASPATHTWNCPPGWVAAAVGGCGPAVFLCAPDGGAAADACGDAPRAQGDGGVAWHRTPDGSIGGAWTEPSAVGIAACPDGWRRLDDGTCDPLLRSDCPSGSGPLPGGGCTHTGADACPAGEYAEPGPDAVGETVVHVRADADAAIADGTAERPFATIQAGLTRAGPQGHVLVAAGTYRERLRINDGDVEIVGACAERVILEGSAPSTMSLATLNVLAPKTVVRVRGMTVRGQWTCLQVHYFGRLIASQMRLVDCGNTGVFAYEPGTTMELSSSLVRNIAPFDIPSAGQGLRAQSGATLRATDVSIDAATTQGAYALGADTSLTLTRALVRGTRAGSSGAFGWGLGVSTGATLRAQSVVIEDSRESGASVDTGGVLILDGAIVRGTRPGPSTAVGFGLSVNEASTLRATNVLLDDNVTAGAAAHGAGAVLTLVDATVRGTRIDRFGAAGFGLAAHNGATLRATGVRVDDCAITGAMVWGVGATMELTSCVVRGTRVDARGDKGFGVGVTDHGTLRIARSALEDNTNAGVIASEESVVTLEDLAIRRTRTGLADAFGRAITVVHGATVRVDRALLADNHQVAVYAGGDDSRLELHDIVIDGVHPAAGGFGGGVHVYEGARVEGERVAMQSVGGAAVIAQRDQGRAAQVHLDDVFVRDVRPSTIQVDDRGGIGFPSGPRVSYGLHAAPGCEIDMARAVIDGGDYGVYNASGAVRVRVGVVARQRRALGAYDFGTALDATSLVDVGSVDNALDALVQRGDLPTTGSLAAPPDPCSSGCP